jgi:hypothetical protein
MIRERLLPDEDVISIVDAGVDEDVAVNVSYVRSCLAGVFASSVDLSSTWNVFASS